MANNIYGELLGIYMAEDHGVVGISQRPTGCKAINYAGHLVLQLSYIVTEGSDFERRIVKRSR